jgi:hypothetical protein
MINTQPTDAFPVAKHSKKLEDADEPLTERIEVRCRRSEKLRWESMVRRKGVGGISSLIRLATNEYCDEQEGED